MSRHVFGLRTDVRDGVHVLDDGAVLFVAGHCVVLHAMDARTQVRPRFGSRCSIAAVCVQHRSNVSRSRQLLLRSEESSGE